MNRSLSKACLVAALSFIAADSVAAQSVAELIKEADSAFVANDATAALRLYERALQSDSVNFEALWKASRSAADLAEFFPEKKRQEELYALAQAYGRRTIAVNPRLVDGHFAVARALGLAALSVGVRDRVKYAVEIRELALAALAIDPKHGGALHVMGVWNAEVRRLNGLERFFAQNVLGGGIMSTATWADATRYLEEAVSQEPSRLVHHLDLARIYVDTDELAKARASYQRVIAGPRADFNDPEYQRAAERELAKIKP